MLALEDEAAIDLVGEHHDVAVTDGARDLAYILFGHHAAGGILRRVQDDDASAVIDLRRELAHVEAEFHLFAQRDRDSFAADEIDHGLVDRETRIGIDDLIPFFNQCKHGEEDDGFAARHDYNFRSIDFHSATMAGVLGYRFAQLGKSGGGAVMRPTTLQGFDAGVDNIARGIEVGLADLEVNDVATFSFESTRFHQNFKCSFRAQARHTAGKTQLRLNG